MERGSAKKLKGSDGISVPVGDINVSYRLDQNIDGSAEGSIGVACVYEAERQNSVDDNQTRDNEAKFNLSSEGKAIENSSGISENTNSLGNFTGYVLAPYENAGNNQACAVSDGPGLSFDGSGSAMDEKQLKRERRKQANRESARKSRLRKQFEYEELGKTWDLLNEENSLLKSEIERLKTDSEKIKRENALLMEKLENGGKARKGEMNLSNAEANSIQINETEKFCDKSGDLDCQTNENGNSEARLHQLLEPSSRSDSVSAR